jgi:outer membrane protein TolC
MNKMQKILVIIFFIFSGLQVYSIEFTLDECITYAQRNSIDARKAMNSFLARTNRSQAFYADFYPQLNLNASLPGVSREINQITQPDGSTLFYEQSQLFTSGALTLSQKIPFLNSELSIASGITKLDVYQTNDYTLWRSTPFQVTYRQPLFKYNSMTWDRKIRELMDSKSDDEFNQEMEDIAINVTRKFFELYLSEMNLKNSEQNVAVNDTLFRLSEGRFSVGKIAENDLLQSELALLNANNTYSSAELEYRRTLDELKITIGYSGSEKISIIPPKDIPQIDISPDEAVRYAVMNNPRITDLEIRKQEADLALQRAESNNRINADIFASFGLNQAAGQFDLIYRDLLDRQRFDVTIQLPLFTWGKGSGTIEAALQDKNRIVSDTELQRMNFEMEVRYLTERLNQLRRQVEISTKADTIAARRFDVAKNRYIIGKIDLNSFFIAQSEKDMAFRALVQNLQSFWLAFYNVRKLTLYDFAMQKRINYVLERK